MAQEEVIIEIKVESADAIKGIDGLYKNINALKKEQEKLNKQFKEGEISLEEYNKQTKAVSGELVKEEKAFKSLTNAVDTQEGSINELTASTKLLIKERNNLNLNTEEGRKRLKEINDQIDINNNKIKENVSGLEKQRLNIGNYKSALEGVGSSLQGIIPGLGGMTTGLSGITAGAKAFTVTPFGATLQIIAGLLAVLIDAFKGSEEGQRNLNKITQVTTALFGALGDGIRELGGFLIQAFENPKKTMMDLVDFLKNNIINRFTAFGVILEGIKNLDFKQVANGVLQFGSGVENVIGKIQAVGERVGQVADKALENGRKVAQLQAEIEDMEDEAKARRAKNDLEVAKLREKAIREEGDAKKKTIEQAIALEKQSAEESVKIAQKRVELAQFELSIATNKKEATDNLEDAEIALTEVQSQRYQATLRFQKEIERLSDAEIARLEKQAAEEEKWRQDAAARALKIEEEKNKKIQAEQKKNADFIERIQKGITQIVSDNEKAQSDLRKQAVADEQAKQQQLLSLRDQALAAADAIFGKTKEGQIALTLISTYLSAQKAFESQFNPVADVSSPIRGAIAAGLAIVQGLARVNEIRKVNIGSSTGSTPSSGGFPTPNGQTITSAATNPINQSFSVANAMSNMPPVYASWKEATEVQNRIKFKESLTTV